MNKRLFSMAILSALIYFPLISSEKQDPLPEHVRKCLGAKPRHNYTCRDSTLEEVAQANARAESEKIAYVRQAAEDEGGPEGIAQFEKMSKQQVIEMYDRVIRDTFLKPAAPEWTLKKIEGAHEQAVAAHNLKLRTQIQKKYESARAKKIKQYDYLSKGSLIFAGGIAALYASNKCNLIPIFFRNDDRYFGAGCIFGLATSFYAFTKKKTILSQPLKLSEGEVTEFVKVQEQAQEKNIKDRCRLQ